MITKEREHLQFIYNRLINIYGEKPNYDYMIRLKVILDEIELKEINDNINRMKVENNERSEVIVKCVDNCTCMSVDKFNDDTDYYITFYKTYGNKSLWGRVKEAWKTIRGLNSDLNEIVLTKEDYQKLRNF
jgi:hypothetical protein